MKVSCLIIWCKLDQTAAACKENYYPLLEQYSCQTPALFLQPMPLCLYTELCDFSLGSWWLCYQVPSGKFLSVPHIPGCLRRMLEHCVHSLGKQPLQSLMTCRCSLHTRRPVTTATTANLTPLCFPPLYMHSKTRMNKSLCKTSIKLIFTSLGFFLPPVF